MNNGHKKPKALMRFNLNKSFGGVHTNLTKGGFIK